jgi:aspartate carbamoyltransferase catalytic subunit
VDLISTDDLTEQQIEEILDRADAFVDDWRSINRSSDDRLKGRIVFNLFYENSTRTLMSFSTAAHRLGASVVTLPVENSSVNKGESLGDTARTLNAMHPDVLVMRHRDNGAPSKVADVMSCPVINAGDGTNEHPTQALLDAATMRSHFGRIEGLNVAICGDIDHSRVAHSNMKLLSRLGATVRLGGPNGLVPAEATSVDEAIEGADVVMMLRVQRERLAKDLGDAPGEYLERYGLTAERLARAAPNAVVMHPGPMNRGVEIDGMIADDPMRSLIELQVEYGVAVRMACLDLVTRKTGG